MLKMALFDCAFNEKCCSAVLTEDGALALFLRPHREGFDSSRVPTPRNLPSKAKKMLMRPAPPPLRSGAGHRWN